ncbi:MAG: hypothetical protein AB2697_19905 [Candidatus Thiodiazotropha endolucinida]
MVEKRFQNEALEFDLERTERSYAFGEPRVGAVLFGDRAQEPDISRTSVRRRLEDVAVDVEEKFAIRKIIEEFEQLHPDEVLDHHGKLTLETYTAVASGAVMQVDSESIKEWVASPLFKKLADRDAKPAEVIELDIVLTDERTASATYSIVQSGQTASSAAILVKGDDGWRIAVHCQHPVAPERF